MHFCYKCTKKGGTMRYRANYLKKAVLFVVTAILATQINFITYAQDNEVSTNLQQKTLKLWYDEPAPQNNANEPDVSTKEAITKATDWENWSLPTGCGYLGANPLTARDVFC